MMISHLVAREYANLIFMIMSLALIGIMSMHVVGVISEVGWEWYERADVKGALAIIVFLIGDTIRNAWIWALLAANNRQEDITYFRERPYVVVAAIGIGSLGALCCIRVFSPHRWRNYIWVSVLMVSVVATAIMAMVD